MFAEAVRLATGVQGFSYFDFRVEVQTHYIQAGTFHSTQEIWGFYSTPLSKVTAVDCHSKETETHRRGSFKCGEVLSGLYAAYVQTARNTFDPLPDQPADFGPRVPREGVEGILLVQYFCTPRSILLETLKCVQVYRLLSNPSCAVSYL